MQLASVLARQARRKPGRNVEIKERAVWKAWAVIRKECREAGVGPPTAMLFNGYIQLREISIICLAVGRPCVVGVFVIIASWGIEVAEL